MEKIRKPFQGVLNIIRFNWHFYFYAFLLVFVMLFFTNQFDASLKLTIYFLAFLTALSTCVSLIASLYIYDLSGFYNLNWVEQNGSENLIVNINAGFDETSELLENKFKNAQLIALDFYDPIKHTEISIKRARKAYPSFLKTKQVTTNNLNLANNIADKIFIVFSAHEIRNNEERILFFKELRRIIKPNGEIYLTEHLRDTPNFIDYNVGFVHFYSKKTWHQTFEQAGLTIKKEIKLTPFVSTFILNKNGNTL